MDLFNFFNTKSSSKSVAKQRLKLILIHDRASLSPELMDKIKEEILAVISKYVEIDSEGLDVKMTNVQQAEEESPALIASIPIKKMKR